MLLCLPRRYRSEDEDYAPRDYSFVGSVAEGARRQQAEPIHKDAESATVRHRADPAARDGVTAAQPPVAEGPRGYDAARRLPRIADGPAPAASVAYPRPRDNGFTKSPTYAPQAPMPLPMAEAQTHPEGFAYEQPSRRDGRYAQAQGNRLDEPQQQTRDRWMQEPDPVGVPQPGANEQTAQEEARNALRRGFDRNAAPQAYDNAAVCEPERVLQPQRSGRAAVQPGDVFAPDGSQYAPPAAQEIPDWLRVAQQNNMPFDEERRRRAPKVEAAPKLEAEPLATDLLGRPLSRRTPVAPNAAPDSVKDYEEAGYPPELINQQRYMEQSVAADMGVGRKRHGAQVAAPIPPRADSRAAVKGRADDRPNSYPPSRADYARRQAELGEAPEYRRGYPTRMNFAPGSSAAEDPYGTPEADRYNPYYAQNTRRPAATQADEWPEDEQPEDDEKPKLNIPYLGIAAFVAALVVVGLWIMQITFTNEKANVIANRAVAEQKLVNNHPYQYRELIEREAAANNLHPAFVAAIVLNESSFNPKAESDVGARGLMQMMPDTAEWVHGKMGLKDEYNFDQMYDAETNVHYACWYLAFLSERFHNDPILVSAAFHAGQNTVQNWLNDSRYSADSQTISLAQMAEGPTKTYATRVLKAYATYRRLYYEGGIAAANPTAADAAASGAT